MLSIPVNNILPNEIIVVMSEFEATNTHDYNAGLFSYLILADSPDATTGQIISPSNGYNISVDMHHGTRDKHAMYRSPGAFPIKYINLVAYSMSDGSLFGDMLKIEPGYGKLNVLRLQ